MEAITILNMIRTFNHMESIENYLKQFKKSQLLEVLNLMEINVSKSKKKEELIKMISDTQRLRIQQNIFKGLCKNNLWRE